MYVQNYVLLIYKLLLSIRTPATTILFVIDLMFQYEPENNWKKYLFFKSVFIFIKIVRCDFNILTKLLFTLTQNLFRQKMS